MSLSLRWIVVDDALPHTQKCLVDREIIEVHSLKNDILWAEDGYAALRASAELVVDYIRIILDRIDPGRDAVLADAVATPGDDSWLVALNVRELLATVFAFHIKI